MPKAKKEKEVKVEEKTETSNEIETKVEKVEKEHNEEDIKEFNEEVLSEFNGSGSSKSGWKLFSVLLAVLLIASVLTSGFSAFPSFSSTNEDDLKLNVLDVVNQQLESYGVEATISDMKLEGGIYVISLEIAGQSMEAYASKDGKYLYPQRLDLVPSADTITGDVVADDTTEFVKADTPNVKMFVMTFCPYGQQAENGLGPALNLLGDTVDFEPHFVIYSDYASRYGADWSEFCYDEEEKYCSMHGRGELDEGVRQLCVFMEDEDKWWDYVNAINAKCDYTNINECWEDVATSVGLSTEKIQSCYDTKAETLLEREVLLAKKFGVQGSPSVFVNDAEYNGGRSPEAYKAGICNSFNEAPEVCGDELSNENAEAAGNC